MLHLLLYIYICLCNPVKKERSSERVSVNSHPRRKRHYVPPTCGNIGIKVENPNGCDHTSTNAPDPIRTPKLSVLGRE